jgi:diguanylate cyclase (GGDEF)-like protein
MNATRKLLSINFRTYIVPIIVVVAIFFATDYLLVMSIRSHYMTMLETQMTSFGMIYSHSLAKGSEAYSLINDLLEEKLLGAARAAAAQLQSASSHTLVELADMLGIDELIVYSQDGIIEYATDDRYIGWQTYPGHPAHGFLTGEAALLVEDIRASSVSGELYKYGYAKAPNGQVVQVGVRADRVKQVLGPFDVQRLVEDIAELELVNHICYVDESSTIAASSDADVVGSELAEAGVQSAHEKGTMYTLINESHHGLDDLVYEVYVPVYAAADRAGTLIITKSLQDTEIMWRTISILGIIASSAVLIGFIYVMFANYKYNKQLAALAYYDTLTGLGNKAHLEHIVANSLGRTSSEKQAIIMTHCLNLSAINSAYGFDTGDRVVQELVRRLKPLVNEMQTLFQFATNRFAWFVRGYHSRDELVELVKRIHSSLEEPLDAMGIGTRVAPKSGIAELSTAHADVVQVFTDAMVALQHAEKSSNSEAYSFFDAQMAAELHREETIAREMREFLFQAAHNTMHLEYQPMVHLQSNRITGFEALARMDSPSLGKVSPEEFIKVAERHDLIIPLGYWVLETACQFLEKVNTAGYRNLHLSVNVSGIQLAHERFIARVRQIINKTGIMPHHLELEITESVLVEGFKDIRSTLEELRRMGIRIAIDDFGTGYSSLSRMERLPVDSIKIHKHFVDSILVRDRRQPIIRDLISMAHNLGLEVVAEGVEHESQRQYLLESGCDIMQGYLFSRPLNAEAAMLKLQES